MTSTSSDALVFFGATGDLAHKKIFPALQAMVKRGHLNVPVIGVAKAGWNLEQLRARASDSLRDARRRGRRGGLRQALVACSATSTATTRIRRRSTSCASSSARRERPLHYLAIPPSLFATVVEQLGRVGLRAGARASSSRSRSAATSLRRRRSTASLLGGLPRVGGLPHRSLPRQGAGAEPALLPLQQLAPRADLEPQLRRQRADHHGRELRRRGPRQLLRRDRRHPRRHRRTTCCR